MNYLKRIAFTAVVFFVGFQVNAQNPLRFQEEIKKFEKDDATTNHEGKILFVGSSSIRFWTSLQKDFPNHKVLNRGFGGSHMSDLIFYLDKLVLKHKPKQVFIYEGDNDVNDKESADAILREAKVVMSKIHKALPKTKIVFISAKPSIARWGLKDKYVEFNSKLIAFTQQHDFVDYIDVWTPMLNNAGDPIKNIFIEDDLHMNAKGYKIWKETVAPYLINE